ncbi:MAG: MlaD family protein [Solirubrobacterales bacterium]
MRFLRAPREIGRVIWGFVNPSRSAGRIPLGRLAIAVQIVGAMIFLGYTLVKKDIHLPFTASRYQVQVIFPDAQGLDPKDGPSAAVAGSPVGKVTDVRYENGRALVTLELDPEVRGKIFADASARVRPASALQNLLVNVDPGSPQTGRLPDGQPIPPQRTSDSVAIDELTSVFDVDTQAYTQILISEAERALHGRAGSLRSGLAELGRLTDTARPVAAALAERRRQLTRLVGDLDQIFSAVSLRGRQLGTAVDAGSRTLAVTSARRRELEQLSGRLAPLVGELRRSLAATHRVTGPLAPALERLAPASRYLRTDARRLRRLLPRAASFTEQAAELIREGRLPLSLLLTGTEGLTAKAKALVPVAKDFSYRAGLLDQYKHGVPQLADTFSGAFSVSDSGGIYGQVDVLKFEAARPENFGISSASRSSSGGGHSRLETLVATALEQRCADHNVMACLMRFAIPGLPSQPLTTAGSKQG